MPEGHCVHSKAMYMMNECLFQESFVNLKEIDIMALDESHVLWMLEQWYCKAGSEFKDGSKQGSYQHVKHHHLFTIISRIRIDSNHRVFVEPWRSQGHGISISDEGDH